MHNILICDDEKDIVEALKIYLKDPEYTLFAAYDGEQALEIIGKEEIHLVLMDIMMPKMDGITAMTKIREQSNVPVIFLTAKGEDSDKILGLTIGADDYITKPFNPLEVVARVRSQLRRYRVLGNDNQSKDRYRIGGIEMDDRGKQVFLDGKMVALTPKEYEILKFLMQHPGKVFPPTQIYQEVWKEMPLGSDNTVAVHIRHLREKLEYDPAEPRYIKVVFGQGYKIEE